MRYRIVPEERIPYWPRWKWTLFYKIENILKQLRFSRKMIFNIQGILLFGFLPIIGKKEIWFSFSGNYILRSLW